MPGWEGGTAGRGRPGGLGILTKVCLPTGPHNSSPGRHEAVFWQPQSPGPRASLGPMPSRAPHLAGAMKVRGLRALLLGRTERAARAAELQLCAQAR